MKKEEFYKESIPGSVGPLEGIKILEGTHNAAGPIAGMVLADLGAESIKIDQPGIGDIERYIPPFVNSESELDRSILYLTFNRNKKNITLNLRLHEGQEIFKQLAKHVDIVIENYKPGTMNKWGLGYEDIKKVKPDIIYTSLSGFGQFGPNSHRPSYDAVAQAMGGLMNVTGYPDGPPTRAGYGLGDDLAGWQSALASIAALVYRMKTGKGQHVDISQQDTILYCSDFGIMATANANYLWQRMGSTVSVIAPYNTYKCKDDYVFIAVTLDRDWGKLCQIMGREDLIDDPRTKTIDDRVKNLALVDESVNDWTKDRTVAEVVKILDGAQIVVAPILNFHQILEDEHIGEREMVAEVKHPAAGRLKLQGVASKFSLTPAKVRAPAPMLGQHNDEIYGTLLGLSMAKIAELRERGVI